MIALIDGTNSVSRGIIPPDWKRWILIGHSAFYLVITIALLLAIFQTPDSLLVCAGISGLSLLAGIWYWFCIIKHPQW